MAQSEREFFMAVLVGIYLVQGDAFEVVRDGKTCWTGTWTLFRSPLMNRADWEPLTDAEVPALFASSSLAIQAGEDAGVIFARDLQGDDGLEPMIWAAVPMAWRIPLKRAG
jgi:hypothetical protein